MKSKHVGGIALIVEKRFAFPSDKGFGLVNIDGHWYIVKFSCPLESIPPRGGGLLVSADATIDLREGKLFFAGHELQLGEEE
jgi:hypothetical protein